MNYANHTLSLGEAARRFLANLSVEEGESNQQEAYKFVRWFGWERPVIELTAPGVAKYAERLSLSDTDYMKKLELIRAFLGFVKKEGWVKVNLAVHLKAKKGKAKSLSSVGQVLPETIPLTQQGYAELKAELAALKGKRPQVIDEMRKAAADKDFRENAPLEAAREQHGQIEGRIKELEATLKMATIIEKKQEVTLKVGIGNDVILHDMASGEQLRYTLVTPREVDPFRGKISNASPLGRAIIGRGEGEVIEVKVPAGKLRYQIKQVER